MAPRQHQGADAEGGGRAHDGADVLRVGDAVQHHHPVGAVGVEAAGGFEVGPGQRLDLQRQALVDGAGRQEAGDLGPAGVFAQRRRGGRAGGRRQIAQAVAQPPGRVGRHQQPVAAPNGIGQGGQHGMNAVEPAGVALVGRRGLALAPGRAAAARWRAVLA